MNYQELNDLELTLLVQYAERELREAINEEEITKARLDEMMKVAEAVFWATFATAEARTEARTEAMADVVSARKRLDDAMVVTNMANTAAEDARLLESSVLRWPGAADRNAELKQKVVENLVTIHTHKMMAMGITSGMTSGNAHTAVNGTGKLIKRRTRKNSKKTNRRKKGNKKKKNRNLFSRKRNNILAGGARAT